MDHEFLDDISHTTNLKTIKAMRPPVSMFRMIKRGEVWRCFIHKVAMSQKSEKHSVHVNEQDCLYLSLSDLVTSLVLLFLLRNQLRSILEQSWQWLYHIEMYVWRNTARLTGKFVSLDCNVTLKPTVIWDMSLIQWVTILQSWRFTYIYDYVQMNCCKWRNIQFHFYIPCMLPLSA
jgi:hypothetical protein